MSLMNHSPAAEWIIRNSTDRPYWASAFSAAISAFMSSSAFEGRHASPRLANSIARPRHGLSARPHARRSEVAPPRPPNSPQPPSAAPTNSRPPSAPWRTSRCPRPIAATPVAPERTRRPRDRRSAAEARSMPPAAPVGRRASPSPTSCECPSRRSSTQKLS
jgi:hypothetical protein